MKWTNEYTFPTDLLEDHAAFVVEHWPDPSQGWGTDWLCLDWVSEFSYILEQLGIFENKDDVLYYIQNPGKFCNEYNQWYQACKDHEEEKYWEKKRKALLQTAKVITNAETY